MRTGTMLRSAAPRTTPAPAVADDSHRTIPFDYAFRYTLTGKPGNVLNDTVEISIESSFVAVSIGYGVIPSVSPIVLSFPVEQPGEVVEARPDVLGVTFSEIANAVRDSLPETDRRLRNDTAVGLALKSGIRLNPRIADAALVSFDRGGAIEARLLSQLFQVVSPPVEDVRFLYALFDEGSGREFQSEPILNIAGLGISNGDRPFRHFPKPIAFAPRAIIRLQITEVSDFPGDLHVTLQGYKVLGQAGTPTASTRQRSSRRR